MGDGRIVRLAEPDNHWAELYQLELAHLRRVFTDESASIEHVGSTAIGTIRAKPTLDILVGVNGYGRFDKWREGLLLLGYDHDPRAEEAEPSRKVFRKGPVELRTHHLHVTLMGGPYWRRLIAFRDYLTVNDVLAREYQALKDDLAMRFPNDGRAYTAAKADFVRRVDALALRVGPAPDD